MTITEQIFEDIKTAMRAKQPMMVDTLRVLRASLITQENKQTKPLTDSESITVIRTEIKKRSESIVSFIDGKRPDLANKEADEIIILKKYLPPALSVEQLTNIVDESIAEAGATTKKDMGKVMKIATVKAANAVDGKTLSQLIQSKLQ